MKITADCTYDFMKLNAEVKTATDDVQIDNCCGQRYIGAGLRDKTITINGTPGNALGSYLDGGTIIVNGNAQDVVGNTMNGGRIIIKGGAGDALGYAMRGGGIFVRGNAGYRTGIHMKEYKDKKPSIVIGGGVGSFLGEYLAGGIIVVLGIGKKNAPPVGNFTGTGMHGGRIFIRANSEINNLPAQVSSRIAQPDELNEIAPLISDFGKYFDIPTDEILKDKFYLLTPNAKNPYKQLYTAY